MSMRNRWVAIITTLLIPAWLQAQDDQELAPVTRTYAITNVNIIQAPGRRVDMGTLIIKDGLITAVGKGVSVPAEAIVIKADSMYVYAGFIDGLTRAGVNKPKEDNKEKIKDPGNPPPDRAGITPQLEVRNFLNPSDKALEDLRNLGFTTVQAVPHGNLLPGHAALVLTGARSADAMLLVNNTALYSELTGAANVYPATILGVMAKWRDLYRQALQAKTYEGLYASNRNGLERPTADRTLEAFYPVIDQRMPVLFKAERLLDANRVLTLKSDLNFNLTLADLKDGWPMISKIKASGAKVFLSLDLPEEMKKDTKKEESGKTKTAAEIEKEGLDKRRNEAIANYTAQAASFQKAGIPFGFTSSSAKSKDIPANLRRMIAAGLSEDAALAALTTTPAQLLGVSDRMGSIDNGKMANLVITSKPYFNEKAKVRYVFVDGVLFRMDVKESKKSDSNDKALVGGTWSYSTDTPQGTSTGKITLKDDNGNVSGTISNSMSNNKETEIKNVSVDGKLLTFDFNFDAGGNKMTIGVSVTVDGEAFDGTMTVGTFGSFPMKGTKDPKN